MNDLRWLNSWTSANRPSLFGRSLIGWVVMLEFHDADTDTDNDILARMSARKSVSVSVSVSMSAPWNASYKLEFMGPTPKSTPTRTLGMQLSCNFVNVYTIAYRVQYTCTRAHP